MKLQIKSEITHLNILYNMSYIDVIASKTSF